MLKRNEEGLYYISETTRRLYHLHKGTSLDGDKEYTDDICYIMDSGFTEDEYRRWLDDDETVSHFEPTFVNWFAGATFLEREEYKEEYANIVKEYVDEYEKKILPIERKEEKNMTKTKQNYIVVDKIEDSCVSGVIMATVGVLSQSYVEGWEILDFLSWLRKEIEDFQIYLSDINQEASKDVFFVIYSDYTDEVQNIAYGTRLSDCIRTEKYVKYYKINITWDAKLEEISLIKTIEERILKTLESYLLVNRYDLSVNEVKDLEEQIEHMKNKIREA